ncbi:hypothetical protein SF1_22760 [Sphingobacterium faecium NBRC 15299]|nr:hypothetical protein SF1_22760 [Sphingobacterium faecium NBRC 15299]
MINFRHIKCLARPTILTYDNKYFGPFYSKKHANRLTPKIGSVDSEKITTAMSDF